MSLERTARAALRLIPATLSVFELRFLFTAAARLAVHAEQLNPSLSSSATWLMLALALAAVFFLRETGRGLLAAAAAGQLILGHTSLAHDHVLSGMLAGSGALPLLALSAVLVVAGVVVLGAIAEQLAAAHSPPRAVAPAEPRQHPPEAQFFPSPAPLLAGLCSRGPPPVPAL